MIRLRPRDKEILKHVASFNFITNSQCGMIFYKGHKRPYEESNRRLNKLCESGYITKYRGKANEEYVYHIESKNKPSQHSIYLMNFYALLIQCGADIEDFKTEKTWLDRKIRSDGFVEFWINDTFYSLFIEVDMYHKTNIKKYEPLYESNLLQNQYKDRFDVENVFPKICIISAGNDYEYKGNLDVLYLDYSLTDFIAKVLV